MKGIHIKSLDKYDQFFRIVGEPFISMRLEDFIVDLEQFIMDQEAKFEGHFHSKSGTLEEALQKGLNNLNEFAQQIAVKREEEKEEEQDDHAKFQKKGYQKQYDMDALPYIDFVKHFKDKPDWKHALANPNSPIVRLLTMGDIFFKKKLIAQQAANMKFADKDSYKSQSSHLVRQINFEKDSSIKTIGQDGSSETVQVYIDVKNLKMLAILLCKGTTEEKASVLFDTVIGMEKVKRQMIDCEEDQLISWNHRRLVSCFKMLIFISEIMPKKYQSEFIDELMAAQNQNLLLKKSQANKHPGDRNYHYRYESSPFDIKPKPLPMPMKVKTEDLLQLKRIKLLWSDEYLVYLEENFNEIFKKMYEKEFIDHIFETNESRVGKEEFV